MTNKEILDSYQYKILLKIVIKEIKKLIALIGNKIEGEENETLMLTISYPKKYMKWTGKYWDVPEFTCGTTRHAKALFRLYKKMHFGNPWPVCVDSYASVKDKKYEAYRQKGEFEKVIIKEYFKESLIEIIWTWNLKEFDAEAYRNGIWGLQTDKFYIAVKRDGEIIKEYLGKEHHSFLKKIKYR